MTYQTPDYTPDYVRFEHAVRVCDQQIAGLEKAIARNPENAEYRAWRDEERERRRLYQQLVEEYA